MTDLNENYNFVALQFCALLILVYLYQLFTGFHPGFSAASSPWWKFFTSVFGHSDLEHLLNNIFFLSLFGSIFERYTSGNYFLFTFGLSALFASISAFIFFPNSSIIGASGGAMGVLAALAMYRPRKPGLVLGIPAPMWAVLVSYIVINTVGIPSSNNVAYEAHLMGLVIGVLIGFNLRDRPYFESNKEEENIENDWRERIREWEEKYMI